MKNRAEAARLNREITLKGMEHGGTTVAVIGQKGCGKTTELLQLANGVAHVDPYDGMTYKDTVVWLAQGYDYWNSIPDQSRIHLHFHKNSPVRLVNERFEPDDFGVAKRRMHTYKDAKQLLSRLVPYAINVIYEPTEWLFSPLVQREEPFGRQAIERYTFQSLDDLVFEGSLFFYELLHVLRTRKHRDQFVSVFADEAGRIFPMYPAGRRFMLQAWLIQSEVIHLRRMNISLYLAAHGTSSIDSRLHDKIQYWIWMRGARIRKDSPVYRYRTNVLEPGEAIIESGMFGDFKVPDLVRRGLVIAEYQREIESAKKEEDASMGYA